MLMVFNTFAEPWDTLSKVVAFTLKQTYEKIQFQLASTHTDALLIFKINGVTVWFFSRCFLILNTKLYNVCFIPCQD